MEKNIKFLEILVPQKFGWQVVASLRAHFQKIVSPALAICGALVQNFALGKKTKNCTTLNTRA